MFLTSVGIPIIKIRRSYDRLFFKTESTRPRKMGFELKKDQVAYGLYQTNIEWDPDMLSYLTTNRSKYRHGRVT